MRTTLMDTPYLYMNVDFLLFTIFFADDTKFQISSNDLRVLYNMANKEFIKATDLFKAKN